MMKLLFYISLLFILTSCNGQNSQLKIINKNTSKEQYTDFVLFDKKIIALSTKGKLFEFEKESGNKKALTFINNFSNITIDNNKNIIVSDTNNVFKIHNNQVEKLYQTERTIKGIVFDKENKCFLITDKGILYTKNDSLYFPNSSFNRSVRSNGEWFKEPTYIIDKNDNIWVGFGYGEWGGDLFIFDTKSKSYIKPNIDSFYITRSPITSITEGNNKVYVGSGLMHFMTSGSIASFENFSSKKIFESYSYRKEDKSGDFVEGEYIGPTFYFDNNLYFYSQNGVFKGNTNKDLTTLKNWQLLLKPKLKWRNGQSDAVGSPMNLIKFIVLENDEIFFLSQIDGIGIFNDNKLIMTN
jgi:hypothetical protein